MGLRGSQNATGGTHCVIEYSQVVKQFEEVSSDIGHRTRVDVDKRQIFLGHPPGRWLLTGKQRRIVEISLWK